MFGDTLGYAAAACLVMALGGCAVYKGAVSEPAGTPSPAATEGAREEEAAPATSGSAPAGGPAVIALMEQARTHVAAEEYSQAAAALERALRIEPKNAVIYSQLAGVMLVQGATEEAENLARKSNSLAGDQTGLQARNWNTIARALRARGENAAADAAELRARQLKSISGE